jgi:hypothetical protein
MLLPEPILFCGEYISHYTPQCEADVSLIRVLTGGVNRTRRRVP